MKLRVVNAPSPAPKPAEKDYPPGTTFGDWFLTGFGGADPHVRRQVFLPDGTTKGERAPREAYRHFLKAYTPRELDHQARHPGEDPEPPRAIQDYVIRLNGKDPAEVRLKAAVQYGHAWINEDFLEKYKRDELYSSIQDRSNADSLYMYLKRYVLTWFITRKRAMTIQSWKEYEKEWGRYLANRPEDQDEMDDTLRLFRDKADGEEDPNLTPKDRQLSGKVLKKIVYEANRFIGYVYKKRRGEFDHELIVLQPFGKTFLDSYAAELKVKNPTRKSKYIKPEHWEIIVKAMKDRAVPWRHQVHLAHDYGLRRRETMGLVEASVRPGYLHLLRQLKKSDRSSGTQKLIFGALKGREEERMIPHWFAESKVTKARIQAMFSDELPHFDTISEGFQRLIKGGGTFTRKVIKDGVETLVREKYLPLTDSEGKPLPHYIFHDLRRTFITNAVKKEIKLEDLRLAVGHKDRQVLERFYVMDSRELEGDHDLPDDDNDEEIIDV